MSESTSKQYFLAALNLGYKNEYEFENGTDCFNFIEREFGLNPFQENSTEINEDYAATSNNKQNFFDYQNQNNCDFTSANKDDGVSQKIYHNFEFVCCDQYVENTEISKGYIVDTSKENWPDYPNQIYLIELEYNYTPEDKEIVSESVCKENILDYSIKIENNDNPQVKDNISESKCKENMSDYPIKIEYNYIPQDKDNTSESVCIETKLEYPIKIENINNYIVHHKDNISESVCKEDMSDCPLKIKNSYNPEDKENISENVSSLQLPKSWTDNSTDYKKNDANNNEIIFESSKNEQIQMKKTDEEQIQMKKTDEEQIQMKKTDEEQIQMKENDGQIQMKHYESKRLILTCDICKKDFLSHEDIVDHLNFHLEQHICHFCGKLFTQEEDLTQHCTLHLPSKPSSNHQDLKDAKQHKQYKKVAKNTNFRKHYLTHDTQHCSICSTKSSSISNVRRHLETMHPDSKIEVTTDTQCPICLVTFI